MLGMPSTMQQALAAAGMSCHVVSSHATDYLHVTPTAITT